eukprot:COSAG02_NODE_35060_length_474_cov_0.986667_2_plen_36_part_01
MLSAADYGFVSLHRLFQDPHLGMLQMLWPRGQLALE